MNRYLISFLGLISLFLLSTSGVFAQKNKWQKEINFLSEHLYDKPDSSMVVCNRALKSVKSGTKEHAFFLSRRAVLNDIQGKPQKAVAGFLEAIEIQRRLKDSVELSFSYNNLGICYFYMYRYDEALRNYRKSARIDSLQNNFSGWAGTMLNVAIIHSNSGENDKALKIYQSLIVQLHEIDDHSLDAVIHSNSAKLHVLSKNYKEALRELELARPDLIDGNDPSAKMTLEVITSNAYMGLKKFDNAIDAAKRGLSYDQGNDYPERRMHLYECLSHAYYAQTLVDSGNFYNDLYQGLRDSIFTLETQEQLSEIQTKYDLARKNQQLSESKLKQARYRNNSERDARRASESRAQRNLFIAIAAILVIVGLILFLFLQRRKSRQRLLEENLKSQEKLLEQKEAFMVEIHHRVRNNLQMVSSMLALQGTQNKNDEVREILESSRSRIETMSLIHERLYKNATGRVIDLNDYLTELTEQLLSAYSNGNVKTEFDVNRIRLHMDTAIPLALIVNELVTNSLKYAFSGVEQPEIRIRIEEKKDFLLFDYSDNGVGYTPETSTGFGTRLIKSLCRQLKAEQSFESKQDGFHTTFKIFHFKKSDE